MACHHRASLTGVVHCDLKPANILLFHDAQGTPQWKLIDFDSAARVGEAVTHGTLDYSAPEVLQSLHQDKSAAASFEMDMYSLGRIIHWLGCDDDNLWPGLPAKSTNTDKLNFLLSEREFKLTNIPDTPTLSVVELLTRKKPEERMTLEQFKARVLVLPSC